MSADGRQRIDKWLFFARVVKSRTLAAKLAQAGRVRINGEKTGQASDSVKPGDVLTITLDRRIAVYKVLNPGARRGPAEEARTLYEDLSPPPAPKDASLPDALVPVRDVGSGRPTRKSGAKPTICEATSSRQAVAPRQGEGGIRFYCKGVARNGHPCNAGSNWLPHRHGVEEGQGPEPLE